ncbi:NAD(P)-dependent oxidoreductase [Clostridium sp. YIM B02506]|uniref:NAD-dependent epimerase/dehydratase family protein n=1 Tax=Clostridium sp. YIM B02506 TaxID=2910680 RepID=UPI001EEF01A9|nr:NAD(P)-dependent oxidoreductase [Clostridium sp. YIM B02506]
MKKIAIIGANSYIARNMISILNQTTEEYRLYLYDVSESHIDNLPNYTKIDVTSKESIKNIEFSCDVIFMFVGKTGSENGFREFDTFIDINEKALLNILNEYVLQDSKAKIIFPSTRLVYKGQKGILREESEKEFKTIYAMNKFACEQYLEMFNRVYGVQYCIFRICLPYGTLIPNATSYGTAEFFLSKASKGESIVLYGDGSVRRTFTYIGDLCNILIKGAFSNKCTNSIFNVGGEEYSLFEVAKLIANKYGVGVEFISWPKIAEKIESGDTVFDSSKLDEIFTIYSMKFNEWISLVSNNSYRSN